MKFNPVELVGLLLLVGGAVWFWANYKPNSPPNALVVVELGIALLLPGAVCSVFFKKK